MEISEKVAYLKGLAEGLNLDTDSKEGKLIAAIIDVLDDMAEKFAEVDDQAVRCGGRPGCRQRRPERCGGDAVLCS